MRRKVEEEKRKTEEEQEEIRSTLELLLNYHC